MKKKPSKIPEELLIETEQLSISQQVRLALLKSELSYYKVGQRAGLNDGVIGAFASGKGSRTSTLDSIAKALDLEVIIRLKEKNKSSDS